MHIDCHVAALLAMTKKMNVIVGLDPTICKYRSIFMKKKILSFITLLAGSAMLFAEDAAAASAASSGAMKYLAAAIAVGLACIAGGMAVGKIGAAAMGAMSENPELSGKALPFVGLAEGICLWGMLVAVLILFR